MNSQPWRSIVVQDASVRGEIAEGARAAWEGFARDMSKDKTAPDFKTVDHWATQGLGELPVIIVLCGDTRVLPLEQMGSSIFPAAQNILLSRQRARIGVAHEQPSDLCAERHIRKGARPSGSYRAIGDASDRLPSSKARETASQAGW